MSALVEPGIVDCPSVPLSLCLLSLARSPLRPSTPM